jgi:hypothetical protein
MVLFILVPLAVVIKERHLPGDFKSRAVRGGGKDIVKLKIVDLATQIAFDSISDPIAIRVVDRHLASSAQRQEFTRGCPFV